MRKITSNWEELNTPELSTIAEPLVRSSRVYYDDIEDPTKTANDIKNMRIGGESITNSNGGGGGNAEFKIKIDPDVTNQLEDRKNGLYVPPVTWEKLT